MVGILTEDDRDAEDRRVRLRLDSPMVNGVGISYAHIHIVVGRDKGRLKTRTIIHASLQMLSFCGCVW